MGSVRSACDFGPCLGVARVARATSGGWDATDAGLARRCRRLAGGRSRRRTFGLRPGAQRPGLQRVETSWLACRAAPEWPLRSEEVLSWERFQLVHAPDAVEEPAGA
eukprot:CAMPEP_0174313132 /NCGR_PEP_ID=MMETSP0810-20121108/4769_1 /TAXON_ID=73025 ORGANISM="Eutreptiella gymnastica-like, Strain CCMP1594" /NCGR_SAMPLE_ID=MMETSP0810 /ASSEMBLY_ACC=CAM_ASM_000659 /LENGTH=106 /DNA_ID=CAMNT_0015421789 /DNA_START=433 /DNA_END=753 /DNA_ORIENTATION=+